MLRGEPKPVVLHLLEQIVTRDLHRHRWPDRQVAFVEVDHDHLPTGREMLLDVAQVDGLFFDVMPHVDEQESIDRLDQQRVVRGRRKSW